MNKIVTTNSFDKSQVSEALAGFQESTDFVVKGKRNVLKNVRVGQETITIKSFKRPHLVNSIVYRFFRKSKAERSFEFATKLLKLDVGTPKPKAYVENIGLLGLKESYYISDFIKADLTYRELVTDSNYLNHEDILRAFTRFTYKLHECGVNFLDHSPGNTLIVKNDDDSYSFFLVDLNRMRFHQMNFSDRMQNFCRLTPKLEMVEVMSDEYAKVSGLNKEKVLSEMWKLTQDFQKQFHRRQKMKRKIKFWKNNN